MVELIDRAAVIAAIKSYCAGCDNYDGVMCRSCGYMDAMEQQCEAAKQDAYESMRQLNNEERIELEKAVAEKNVAITKDVSSRGEKHFSEAGKVVVAKKETTTGEDINVPTKGGEEDVDKR